MKFLSTIILTFMLTGCYQSVNLRDIKDASAICGGLDEVTEISSFFTGREAVTCSNRLIYWVSSESLKSVKENSK